MRRFIHPKPHVTAMKLYVLPESTAHVFDMYRYQGNCHIRDACKHGCVGCYTSARW